MSPSSKGDSSSAVMVLSRVVASLKATESGGHTLPMIGILVGSRLRVRSPLIGVHVSPRLSLRYTRSPAKYRRREACGEAVAAADVVPVAGPDAGAVLRARRAADRPVILRAAAHLVERPRLVRRDPVELRERQVGEVPPRLHAVVGLVHPAIVADE